MTKHWKAFRSEMFTRAQKENTKIMTNLQEENSVLAQILTFLIKKSITFSYFYVAIGYKNITRPCNPCISELFYLASSNLLRTGTNVKIVRAHTIKKRLN